MAALKRKLVFFSVLLLLVFAGCPQSATETFHEGWESAQIGVYPTKADSLLKADEGIWSIGDTVSEFPECGTPQLAEILSMDGSRVLRLVSHDSNSGCSDNIWVEIADFSLVGPSDINRGFSVPFDKDTFISFKMTGELTVGAQARAFSKVCGNPPCFDNITLFVGDNNKNVVAYVLQHESGVKANDPDFIATIHKDIYREIFLDPDAGIYSRNLYDDFNTIPNFIPKDAKVVGIQLEIDEHGWTAIDDIAIGKGRKTTVPLPGSPTFGLDDRILRLPFVLTRPGNKEYKNVTVWLGADGSYQILSAEVSAPGQIDSTGSPLFNWDDRILHLPNVKTLPDNTPYINVDVWLGNNGTYQILAAGKEPDPPPTEPQPTPVPLPGSPTFGWDDRILRLPFVFTRPGSKEYKNVTVRLGADGSYQILSAEVSAPGQIDSTGSPLFNWDDRILHLPNVKTLPDNTPYINVDVWLGNNGTYQILAAGKEPDPPPTEPQPTPSGPCDLVGSIDSHNRGFLQIINNQNIAIEVTPDPGSPTAYMRPNECVTYGLWTKITIKVEIVRCDIDTEDDCSGPTRTKIVSLTKGETTTIDVSSGFF